jgi:putative transposase
MPDEHRRKAGIRLDGREPPPEKAARGNGKGKSLPKKSSGIFREGNRIAVYRFIQNNHDEFGLRWLLKRCGIYPNSYYNFLKDRKKNNRERKEFGCGKIAEIYHKYDGIPGHRQMKFFLEKENIFISKTTVYRYMNREMQLFSIVRKKKPGYRKGMPHETFPNLLQQNFTAPKPNKVWCTDFTYLPLANGSMRYNCTIIDLFNRGVVSSVTGSAITSQLAIDTLSKALSGHSGTGIVLHSDQGSQFTSKDFTDFCKLQGIVQSMSRAGCPYDNAPMERYFNTLKNELIYHHIYRTEALLYAAVSDFAYLWYNLVRPHSFNGGLPPAKKRVA